VRHPHLPAQLLTTGTPTTDRATMAGVVTTAGDLEQSAHAFDLELTGVLSDPGEDYFF